MLSITRKYGNTSYQKARVFRAQADWIVILQSATSCETAASLADNNACAKPVLVAYTAYFFHYLLINYSN
jgi:hypothetical protein